MTAFGISDSVLSGSLLVIGAGGFGCKGLANFTYFYLTSKKVGNMCATAVAACQRNFVQFGTFRYGMVSDIFHAPRYVAAVFRTIVHMLACKTLRRART